MLIDLTKPGHGKPPWIVNNADPKHNKPTEQVSGNGYEFWVSLLLGG
jgi:hypothetical protein